MLYKVGLKINKNTQKIMNFETSLSNMFFLIRLIFFLK